MYFVLGSRVHRSTSFYAFFWPSCYHRPSFLSPSYTLTVVTQVRGHIAGGSSPSPPRLVPCILSREKNCSFLLLSTRVELCLLEPALCALSSQQLILFIFLYSAQFVQSDIRPRRDLNLFRTDSSSSSRITTIYSY